MAKKDKLLNLAKEHLDGETIVHSILGAYKTKTLGNDTVRNGIFIATESRVLFYGKRTLGFEVESFPFSNISSIELGKKLMGKYITFFSSGNKVEMQWINDEEVDVFLKYVKSKIGKKESLKPSDSSVDEIRKYKQLADEGIITEEEFESKKKQLLNI